MHSAYAISLKYFEMEIGLQSCCSIALDKSFHYICNPFKYAWSRFKIESVTNLDIWCFTEKLCCYFLPMTSTSSM